MKEFLVAMIVAAALLIPFRESNGRSELSDAKEFAHLCIEAIGRICALRP
jgi:hypothetical protein